MTRHNQHELHSDTHFAPAAKQEQEARHRLLGESGFELANNYRAGSKREKESVTCNFAAVAEQQDGQQLWRLSPFAKSTENGRLGCAASACIVLQKSGHWYANSPTVGGLQAQLLKHGWTKHQSTELQGGDLLVAVDSKNPKWQNGGGSAHIGAAANDGMIWNNSKRNGAKWTKEAIDVAFPSTNYDTCWVLRPPKN
ncbi:MAG: hypothetical protein K2X81_29550 [Candidatus Obscuribacterales bacterium]|nr:hypothetical protein [Candidatus Obscuribacterales bacterium]